MKKLTYSEFNEVKTSGTNVVTFGAPCCKDCKVAMPLLMELENEYPNVNLYGVDVDEEEEIRDEMGIRHIPTVLFLKDGVEVCPRVVEPKSKAQLEECFKKLS